MCDVAYTIRGTICETHFRSTVIQLALGPVSVPHYMKRSRDSSSSAATSPAGADDEAARKASKAAKVAAKVAAKKARRVARAAGLLPPPAALGQTFKCMDGGVDIAAGLVLHRDSITDAEEQALIDFVNEQCERGRRGEVRKPTYLRANVKSMGNQRESLMYGGFFDFNRARPGKRGLVPPFPPIIEALVEKLVSGGLLPASVRPDSCIINSYR